MQAAVLFVADNVGLDWFPPRLGMLGKTYYRSDKEWAIERGKSWAVIGIDDFLSDELDDDEVRRIEEFLPTSTGFLLRFSDVEFASEVLKCLRDEPVVVDNDHGVIVPIASVLAEPGWERTWYTKQS